MLSGAASTVEPVALTAPNTPRSILKTSASTSAVSSPRKRHRRVTNTDTNILPRYNVHVESYTVEVGGYRMPNRLQRFMQGTNFSSRHAQYYIMCACADETKTGWVVNHRYGYGPEQMRSAPAASVNSKRYSRHSNASFRASWLM